MNDATERAATSKRTKLPELTAWRYTGGRLMVSTSEHQYEIDPDSRFGRWIASLLDGES
jgi:hypothetical protein